MLDENNLTPQDDEPEESVDSEFNTDNMSAGIISEDDFETVGPYDDDDFQVEYLPDEETEVLPSVPDDIVEDWKRIQESDDGYLPENAPRPHDDVEDALSQTSESLDKVESVLAEAVDHAEFEAEDRYTALSREIAAALGRDYEEESPTYSEYEEEENPEFDDETDEEFQEENEPESDEKPYIREPSKPAWKIHAEQMRAEEEAKKRKMIEDRRAYEAARHAERQAALDEIREGKRQADAKIKADFTQRRKDTASAMDDMMQRIRDEKEQKRREQESALEEIRREREAKSYKNHSDDVEVEAPKPIKPEPVKREPIKPKADKSKSDSSDSDLDARLSRLSKPEPNDDKS